MRCAYRLAQLLSVDRFRRVAVVVGYSLLNVFVESGSNRHPETDLNALQAYSHILHSISILELIKLVKQ